MIECFQPTVGVYVASSNTAKATELCIRTSRALAGYPHSLTVGDCGSVDGSLGMLRHLESLGWLSLEVAPSGRFHADWLDLWLSQCQFDLAVFVDSDVEFLREGWLRDLVMAAEGAALVAAEILPEFGNFAVPVPTTKEGELVFAEWFRGRGRVRLAPRPSPWLFLVDVKLARGLDTGFGFSSELADVPEEVLAYDVGGVFYRRLEQEGHRIVAMPPPYHRVYRHYGGLSWVPLKGRRGLKKRRDLMEVCCRLWHRRLVDHWRASRSGSLRGRR